MTIFHVSKVVKPENNPSINKDVLDVLGCNFLIILIQDLWFVW